MSKWLRKDDYEMFADQKAKEAENQPQDGGNFFKKWKNPQMGTTEKAKEYKVRLLPDPEKGFYKEYLYHGFTSGEKFKYFLCEKTPTNLDAYCPWCEANKILYQGNASDKKKAADYKRKNRFVSNVFIVDDPRDVDVKDEQYKVNGTVRLYEFPGTVESKIANEINDKEQGYGLAIFDPEDGFDFILKVKAKPKDQNGKEWPDYGDTIFARRATPMCEEDKMDSVMEQRVKLEEYIESMKLSAEDHEALLKAEMLWEDVGHNFERHFRAGGTASTSAPTPTPAPESAPVQESAPEPEPQASSSEQDDTDALLEELQNM